MRSLNLSLALSAVALVGTLVLTVFSHSADSTARRPTATTLPHATVPQQPPSIPQQVPSSRSTPFPSSPSFRFLPPVQAHQERVVAGSAVSGGDDERARRQMQRRRIKRRVEHRQVQAASSVASSDVVGAGATRRMRRLRLRRAVRPSRRLARPPPSTSQHFPLHPPLPTSRSSRLKSACPPPPLLRPLTARSHSNNSPKRTKHRHCGRMRRLKRDGRTLLRAGDTGVQCAAEEGAGRAR